MLVVCNVIILKNISFQFHEIHHMKEKEIN